MTSGTNLHSRYHPDYFLKEEIPSDSNKSYPDNGGNRVPLLRKRSVYRTDSGIRSLTPSAPARTNRRLSGASEQKQIFRQSLCDMYSCHLTTNCPVCQHPKMVNFYLWKIVRNRLRIFENLQHKNIWLFHEDMIKCCQYFKGCDDDGPEP